MSDTGTSKPIPVAILCGTIPPYRVHLHRRLASEIPEIQLWTLCTHAPSDERWSAAVPEEIRPVLFGEHDASSTLGNPKYSLREWRKGGRIIQWLREHRVRAIVVSGYNDTCRVRVLRWCRRNGVPAFLMADSNVLGDRATGIKRTLKKTFVSWILRGCAGVMPLGQRGQAYFERYGVTKDRMFNCPLMPDFDLIRREAPACVAEVREKYRLPANRRRIVYSGRLIPLKRVDLILDAFASLAPQRPEWDLVIAGDGPLREELKKRVPPALAARVTWCGFIDDQTVMSSLYLACDVLVLASDYEAWSLVLIEAAAAGLALVSSSIVGANPEILQDGVNGRIFTSENLPELKESLLDVTDPAKIDGMKQQSPVIVAQWQRTSDPVEGFRRALRSAQVL